MIRGKVYGFKTKFEHGFTYQEIDELLKDFPSVSRDDFYEKLGINTCMIVEREVINYHCDVELALRCCIEKRDKSPYEWD